MTTCVFTIIVLNNYCSTAGNFSLQNNGGLLRVGINNKVIKYTVGRDFHHRTLINGINTIIQNNVFREGGGGVGRSHWDQPIRDYSHPC